MSDIDSDKPAGQGMPMVVDSHCHLDFPDFAEDLDDVVTRARASGVGVIQTICTKITEFERVRAVAARFDDMYCSVGVHPHEAESQPMVTADRLAELADDPKVIGIGETGLDYYYEHAPREAQKAQFRAHIEAARRTRLPLIVHTREADDDTIDILSEEAEKGAFPGLIHCFTSSRRLAEASLDLGMSISISGIVTFKSARELQETVKLIPLDRLLVETDAPYLAPVPKRGKRNEPQLVVHTAQFVAELKGVGYAELAERTTENFFRLFDKARRPT